MAKTNKIFDSDTPWDLLMQSVEALEHHAEVMNNIIGAHNQTQTQLNRARQDIHNLNKRITQLERILNEIS